VHLAVRPVRHDRLVAAELDDEPLGGIGQPLAREEDAGLHHGLVVGAHLVDDLLEVHLLEGLHGVGGGSHDQHVLHRVLTFLGAPVAPSTIASNG
jgi:hypothetical protein